MKRFLLVLFVLSLANLEAFAKHHPKPTPRPSVTPTPTATATPRPTPTPTPTTTPTATPIPGAPPVLPQGNNGIAASYPSDVNIQNHSDVLFSDNFESYTSTSQLTTKWSSFYHTANTRIATEPNNVYKGSRSLEFTLLPSSVEVSNGVIKNISPTQSTLFIRYYTKFDSGYSVSGSNHNGARLSAKYPGPGTVPNGQDFFLFEVQNNINYGEAVPGYTHVYAYHPEQRSQWGDAWYPNGKILPFDSTPNNFGKYFVARANFIPQRDRWYGYEMMVKANTPGQRDGRVAFWIDGNLMADFQNLRIRDTNTLSMDQMQLELHSKTSTRSNKKWYDNVVLAKSYIGPVSGATATPTPTATTVPTATPVPTTTPSPTFTGSVVLDWDASPSSNVVGYRVYYTTVKGNYTGAKTADAGNSLTAAVDNLSPGVIYYFVVTARTSTKESAYSNEVSYP